MGIIAILTMIGQFILGLSLIVAIHEAGHMLTALWFGMRVEKYYIGFPPKVFSFEKNGTEFGLGAIPLGGFVKISGMIDESLDTANLSAVPEPWEFRAKPAWQRMIVMLGGIIFNVITGIIIFAGMFAINGEKVLTIKEAKYGIVASEIAQSMGLQTGDRIVKINDKPIVRFYEVLGDEVVFGSQAYYNVLRDGQEIKVAIPKNLLERLSEQRFQKEFISPRSPFSVGRVQGGMPAAKAGLLTGDVILAVNDVQTPFFDQFQTELRKNANKIVLLTVKRAANELELKCNVTTDGRIGFEFVSGLNTETITYSWFEAVPRGVTFAAEIIGTNIKGLSKIFTGEVSASNSIQGPISMAQDLYGGIWDWGNFWRITGLISIVIAFMNLLPIPALDGGHVVFLLFEIITGRKPSERFLEIAQRVGMVLLLSLMAFAFFNDIIKRLF